MKNYFGLLLGICCWAACSPPPAAPSPIVTTDIDLFWEAYDQIIATEDTAQQRTYFQELYLDKGSPGLAGIIQARNYTADEYLEAIRNYPKFWNSVRTNTLKAKDIGKELEAGVVKLKKLYPDLKPAPIYLTVGALRTNGTVLDTMLLIGTELAMADSTVVSSEFPERLGHLPVFFQQNPIDHVVALNIHEYIHTQQNARGGYDLLSQSVFEGVAEFVPVVALGVPSATPAIAYGKANDDMLKARFAQEMFEPWIYNWIWNSLDNEFGVRDLGYYMGYAIAEKYYEKAPNKPLAIKELIELDYEHRDSIEAFVDRTGYFAQPIAELKATYEKSRPTVVEIQEFENGSTNVSPSLSQITLRFSQPMATRFRSTDYGPLGKEHFAAVDSITFSDDGNTVTYFIKGVEPNKKYQLLLEAGYRSKRGALPLVPYLVEFSTRDK